MAGFSSPIRHALATGASPRLANGIHRLEGEVRFNGKPRRVGDLLSAPLEVVTGERALAAFSLGRNAYLVRGNSRISIADTDGKGADVWVEAGRLLSVFEKGEARVMTPTAVAGIRGTGIYVETEAERSYVCLCYGTAELAAAHNAGLRETVSTTHHESPRYISTQAILPAPVINHTDAELILLESLVGRVPPFALAGAHY
ncbi:MAG: FecR domain-containing protein [Hydrogenophilaceae bacterium]|nr:FecR domain-containing protein [Hydrogenophilaceae bacterium]